MHYLLIYDVVPDYAQRRTAFRAEHLTLARQACARRFAEADPYVKNGLVTRWRVRPWTTVIGEQAATPL